MAIKTDRLEIKWFEKLPEGCKRYVVASQEGQRDLYAPLHESFTYADAEVSFKQTVHMPTSMSAGPTFQLVELSKVP